MATNEDCASVLEQFIHDAANLPAEINHMMEEIEAKDKELQKSQSIITGKDGNLQKHLKINGILAPHPKENEYAELMKKNYELCSQLQKQKVQLSEKACALLDRQIRKFDIKIRELQNDGQLLDGPQLPSIFNRKSEPQKPFLDAPNNLPLQAASISALNANRHSLPAQMIAGAYQGPSRPVPQISTTNAPAQRSSTPVSPAIAIQQQRQRERENSQGAENKRRKLGNPLAGTNLPSQPSSLRQSSLGPGTPKAGTPTGTSGSRAGSLPRTTTSTQQGTTAAGNAPLPIGLKKSSNLSKKVFSHQQINRLKNKHTKHARLSSGPGRKKGQSPSVRGGRGGTAASEDADSVLSSADASETDGSSQPRSRRGHKKQPHPGGPLSVGGTTPAEKREGQEDEEEEDEAEVEGAEDEEIDEEEGEDDKRYCFCNQRSYGEMVACENDDCPYQWFHTGCLNMKKVPDEDEDWYCPTCREKAEIIEKVRLKKKAGTRK